MTSKWIRAMACAVLLTGCAAQTRDDPGQVAARGSAEQAGLVLALTLVAAIVLGGIIVNDVTDDVLNNI